MTQATKTRWFACVERVNELSTQLELDTDPFQVIRDALRPSTPTSSDLTCKGGSAGTGSELRCFFLRIATTPKWECLKHWEMQEISLERLDELLWERRGEVERSVLDWREVVETQLVGIEADREGEALGTEGQDPRDGVIVKVNGAPTPLHISPTTPTYSPESTRYSINLAPQRKFPLDHHITETWYWKDREVPRGKHATRHPVVYRYVRDFAPVAVSKPLVRIIPTREEIAMNTVPNVPAKDRYHYQLRYYTGRVQRAGIDKLRRHMQDVHEITEPTEGLYHGKKE
ncbi:hypothetical protein BDV93DRAFT_612251 [Ceratobasidium sp. AG-I]|nr:hypothetical protein BDV93DRAFT_612251 [Ceratobasidium sp. AG-I]